MASPLVSICIPAYKKPDFVRRALDSVTIQRYTPMEVIVTDDSPDASLEALVNGYAQHFPVRYLRNAEPLGSPRNWNMALSMARGELVLLLHQDDWLSGPDSISAFVAPFQDRPDMHLVFGRSRPVDREGKDIEMPDFQSRIRAILRHPDKLILGNLLGHPSNLMIRNGLGLWYDPRYIWLVDFEYYRRVLLLGGGTTFLDKTLVEVGVHADQITNRVGEDKDTLLREHLLFAKEMGNKAFEDISIYDHYWRLFRNQGVRSAQELSRYADAGGVLPLLVDMVRAQGVIPPAVLRNGVGSKLTMTLSYLQHLLFGRHQA